MCARLLVTVHPEKRPAAFRELFLGDSSFSSFGRDLELPHCQTCKGKSQLHSCGTICLNTSTLMLLAMLHMELYFVGTRVFRLAISYAEADHKARDM